MLSSCRWSSRVEGLCSSFSSAVRGVALKDLVSSGWIQLDLALERAKSLVDERFDMWPGETPMTATKSGNRDGRKAFIVDRFSKCSQAVADPFDSRRLRPMLLCREADNQPWTNDEPSRERPHSPNRNFSSRTSSRVTVKQPIEAFGARKSDPFTHCALCIDRADDGFGLAIKHVARTNFDHSGCPSCTNICMDHRGCA